MTSSRDEEMLNQIFKAPEPLIADETIIITTQDDFGADLETIVIQDEVPAPYDASKTCSICSKTFADEGSRIQHEKNVHSTVRVSFSHKKTWIECLLPFRVFFFAGWHVCMRRLPKRIWVCSIFTRPPTACTQRSQDVQMLTVFQVLQDGQRPEAAFPCSHGRKTLQVPVLRQDILRFVQLE